ASLLIQSILSAHWGTAVVGLAEAGLWTGNASGTTFSPATLDLAILMGAAGLAIRLFALRTYPLLAAEKICAGIAAVFVPVLMFAVAFMSFGGIHWNSTSWYSAGLLAIVCLLIVSGWARGGSAGIWVLRAALCLAAYLVIATYWFKLI